MKTEVAIVGGGPGGSTSAMFLLREGIKPIIIEKETFPRYHVGESMTGEYSGVVRALLPDLICINPRQAEWRDGGGAVMRITMAGILFRGDHDEYEGLDGADRRERGL